MWAGRLLQHRTHIGLWHSSEGERTVALPLRQKKKNSSTFGDNPSCGCESTLRNTDSRQRVAHNNLRILQWKTYSISGTRFRLLVAIIRGNISVAQCSWVWFIQHQLQNGYQDFPLAGRKWSLTQRIRQLPHPLKDIKVHLCSITRLLILGVFRVAFGYGLLSSEW